MGNRHAAKVHLVNRELQERLESQEHQGHLLTAAVVRVLLEILDDGNNALGYMTIQRMAETMDKCMRVTLLSSGAILTFAWFTWVIFVSLAAQGVVRDDTSLSMEQSAKFPLPLMVLCTKAPTSTSTDPPT